MSIVCPRKCPRHPKVDLHQTTFETPYKCDGCKMDGIGIGHKCPECKHVLHSQCLNPKQSLRPSFLPNHVFSFMTSPLKKSPQRFCDACGIKVEGFVYSTSQFDLHPCCASLQKSLEVDDLKFILKTDTRLWNCHACNRSSAKGTDNTIPGWCYAREDDPHYGYHVYCIVNRAVEEVKAIDRSKGRSLSKKASSSSGSDGYFTVFTALVNYVIAILCHDPIAITKLVVNDVIQITQLLSRRL